MVNSGWSYGQRVSIELAMVVITWGLLVSLACQVLPTYTRIAQLVEPVYLSQWVRTEMMIEMAWRGTWPGVERMSIDTAAFSGTVRAFDISADGHIDMALADRYPELGGHNIVFNLNTLSSDGFDFYAWSCGNAINAPPYRVNNPVPGTLPSLYSKIICRL